jgi:hypothetical protein
MFVRTRMVKLLLMGFALAASSAAWGDLTLAEHGLATAVIVVGDDATAAEATAAAELAACLKRVTGAEFTSVPESAASRDTARILIGQSDTVKALLPGFDWEALGHDGIVIKVVGQDLILTGGRPRGALYAVYSFLEDVVGCRWWTPSTEYMPSTPRLRVGKLNTVYTPPFIYREAYWQPVSGRNPDFAVRLKLNGNAQTMSAAFGGHYTILGWCHTFSQLLPPATYFKDHPEWYSEIGGNRLGDGAQLCLTNLEMRAELVKRALEWIQANPAAGIISIAQNDCGNPCRCVNCKAVVDREEADSGLVVQFVNAVAEEIEKQYPSFLVETLAYQYTRHAPTYARPRRNVIVRLCSIECDFARPLDSAANGLFFKDLQDWAAISPQLYIWDYTPNFGNYLIPHPNWRVLAPNIRIFAAHKAVGVFEQGDCYNENAGFNHLKLWLLAHLLWNPAADERRLTAEFLRGYYGPAAPLMQRYIGLTCDAIERSGVKLGCGGAADNYLTLKDMNKATRLFDKAEAAVRSNPDLLRRVQIERLALDHAWLLNASLDRFAAGSRYPKDYTSLAERFVAKSREWGAAYLSEGALIPDTYAATLTARGSKTLPKLKPARAPAVVPERCRGTSRQDWLDVQDGRFLLANAGNWVEIVNDAAASDGRAAMMPASHVAWATQWHVSEQDAARFTNPECFLSIRCAATSRTGNAFEIGIYDPSTSQTVAHRLVALADSADGLYHEYSLGRHELKLGMYFWVAPFGNANEVEAIYTDRVFLVK